MRCATTALHSTAAGLTCSEVVVAYLGLVKVGDALLPCLHGRALLRSRRHDDTSTLCASKSAAPLPPRRPPAAACDTTNRGFCTSCFEEAGEWSSTHQTGLWGVDFFWALTLRSSQRGRQARSAAGRPLPSVGEGHMHRAQQITACRTNMSNCDVASPPGVQPPLHPRQTHSQLLAAPAAPSAAAGAAVPGHHVPPLPLGIQWRRHLRTWRRVLGCHGLLPAQADETHPCVRASFRTLLLQTLQSTAAAPVHRTPHE